MPTASFAFRLAAGLGLSVLGAAAAAATTSASIPVSATIGSVAACTISAPALVFGAFSSLAAPVDASSSVTVSCTGASTLLAITVSMNAGTTPGATVASRLLQNIAVSSTLGYAIYTDAARTQLWGDGTSGTVAEQGALPLGINAISLIAYGRIPAGQTIGAAGAFADSVTMTLTF